jgi:hypothetical protein
VDPRQRDVLRALARGRGIPDIRRLCQSCRVPRQTLYRLVSGHSRESTIAAVAARLRISVEDLRSIIAMRGES